MELQKPDTRKDPTKDNTALDSEILIASELQHINRESESDYEAPPSSQRSLDDEVLERLFSELGSWSFDIFQINDDNLPKMVERIFKELGFFDAFKLDIRKFRAFTRAMVARYQPNPYHNFRHACDVLHAVYLILTIVEAAKLLTHLERFALALAALCHDVDHPGLTNAFLSATYDPLALRYNDRGVLENHHAATCFITMRGHDAVNLLSAVNEVEQRHMRKLMLTIILATDMEQHSRILRELTERLVRPDPFEMSPPYTPPGSLSPLREEFRSFASSPPGSPPRDQRTSGDEESKGTLVKVYRNPLQSTPLITSSNDVMLLLQMIIKCADLSNVVKPFFLSKRWAALLLLEWFRQGEIEKQLGLPISKFMDREDPTTLMAMTCGCIDYIAKPMYEATAKLLPKLQEEVLPTLSFNRNMWTQFSTNGRRASETAQRILGPYAPPPVPKGFSLEEEFGSPPGRAEGRLVATFNGHYEAPDLQPSRKGSPQPQKETVPSTSEATVKDSAPSNQPPLLPASPAPPSEHFDTVTPENLQVDVEKPQDVLRHEKAKDAVHDEKPEDVMRAVYHEKLETAMHDRKQKNVELDEIPEEVMPVVHHEKLATGMQDRKQKNVVHDENPEDAIHYEKPGNEVQNVKPKVLVESPIRKVDVAQSEDLQEHPAKLKAVEEHVFHSEKVETDVASTSGSNVGNHTSSMEEPHVAPQSESETGHESESEPEPEPEPEPESEEGLSGFSASQAPLSLLFGTPSTEESLLQLPGKSGIEGLHPAGNLLIVDRNKRSIDAMVFRRAANVSVPVNARAPSFKSGVIDPEAEKGKIVVPQPTVHVGFWDAIRTHPRMARLNKAMDSTVWNAVFIVATLFALFADDVVKGFLPKAADMYEAHVLTACLVLFLLESAFLSILRDGYFISFFFW